MGGGYLLNKSTSDTIFSIKSATKKISPKKKALRAFFSEFFPIGVDTPPPPVVLLGLILYYYPILGICKYFWLFYVLFYGF